MRNKKHLHYTFDICAILRHFVGKIMERERERGGKESNRRQKV